MLMDSLWEQVESRLQAWVGRDPYWHSSRNIANQEYFVIFQQVTSVLAERIEDRLKHTNLFAFNEKNCWNIFANVLENPNLFLAGIINNLEPLQPLYNNLSFIKHLRLQIFKTFVNKSIWKSHLLEQKTNLFYLLNFFFLVTF